jgi:hypothetical protein
VAGETPTQGIDEVQGHNTAPELESPLASDAAHLLVSDRLYIQLMSITPVEALMKASIMLVTVFDH